MDQAKGAVADLGSPVGPEAPGDPEDPGEGLVLPSAETLRNGVQDKLTIAKPALSRGKR